MRVTELRIPKRFESLIGVRGVSQPEDLITARLYAFGQDLSAARQIKIRAAVSLKIKDACTAAK